MIKNALKGTGKIRSELDSIADDDEGSSSVTKKKKTGAVTKKKDTKVSKAGVATGTAAPSSLMVTGDGVGGEESKLGSGGGASASGAVVDETDFLEPGGDLETVDAINKRAGGKKAKKAKKGKKKKE